MSPTEPLALKVYMTPAKIEFRGPDRYFQLYKAKSKMRSLPPFTNSARDTLLSLNKDRFHDNASSLGHLRQQISLSPYTFSNAPSLEKKTPLSSQMASKVRPLGGESLALSRISASIQSRFDSGSTCNFFIPKNISTSLPNAFANLLSLKCSTLTVSADIRPIQQSSHSSACSI